MKLGSPREVLERRLELATCWPSAWPAFAVPLVAWDFSTRRFGALVKIIEGGKKDLQRVIENSVDNDRNRTPYRYFIAFWWARGTKSALAMRFPVCSSIYW